MKEIDLPDFEDMYKLVLKIKDKTIAASIIEAEIDIRESEISKEVVHNEYYFIKGNPPSQAHIQRAFFPAGLEGELIPKRKELAKLKAEIEYLKMHLDLDKMLIEVWRTESANKRSAVS